MKPFVWYAWPRSRSTHVRQVGSWWTLCGTLPVGFVHLNVTSVRSKKACPTCVKKLTSARDHIDQMIEDASS